MVVGQVLVLAGTLKDDKDLIITGASVMLADNIFYIGKLIGEGVYNTPDYHEGIVVTGDDNYMAETNC
jgi:hypothetical protein